MNLIQDDLIGVWIGEHLLRLSWLTPSDFVTQSELTVSSAAKGKFPKFDYTWNHEDVSLEGYDFAWIRREAGNGNRSRD